MKLGVLEALTAAAGESLNAAGGRRSTRLLNNVAAGATTFAVEYSYDWPTSGTISIDGVVYHYTANNDGSFGGIYYVSSGTEIAGALHAHLAYAEVLDVSQSYSALDLVRQAFLVNYAEGDDLSALGRNLGVLRLTGLKSDDQFRNIVKALAYNPKGTIYGIKIALDAMVGAGNYTVYEDLENFPCTVFIAIPGSIFLDTAAQGKTYLTGFTSTPAVSSVLSYTLPAVETYPFMRVGGLTLYPDSFTVDCRTALPSAYTLPARYTGDAIKPFVFAISPETTYVQVSTAFGGCCQLYNSTTVGSYNYAAQITPKSFVRFTVVMSVGSDTVFTANCNTLRIVAKDGISNCAVGFEAASAGTYTVGFVGTSNTTFVGTTVTLNMGTFYEIGVHKRGTVSADLLINGAVVNTQPMSAFGSSTSSTCLFGKQGAFVGTISFRYMNVSISTPTDYWSAQGVDGVVAASSPTTLSITSATVTTADIGKQMRISNSVQVNASGGNNNCVLNVLTVPTSASMTLASPVLGGVQVSALNPTRITVVNSPAAFTYPDDLGKTIVISNSTAGNNGTYTISQILDPNTLANLGSFLTKITSYSNVCQVSSAAFVPESSLSYRLSPQFVNETALTWELSDAGTVSAPTGSPGTYTITPRQALPYPNGVYNLLVDQVLSAQMMGQSQVLNTLESEGPPATFAYWPFYIEDPYYFVEQYVSQLVAAGVNVVFNFT